MIQDWERFLAERGLRLPPPPQPVGTYQPFLLCGSFAYLSGQISKDSKGNLVTGKVGRDLTLEEAKRAAEMALLQAVSLIRGSVGLEKVEQVIRMIGFVQSANDFYGQSEVMNAASELLLGIFGEKGRHARTAVGVTSLPLNAAIEIELTLRLR